MTISQQDRTQIIYLHGRGLSCAIISAQMGICRRTVERWVQRFKRTGATAQQPIPGRPLALNADQRAQVIQIAKSDGGKKSLREILCASRLNVTRRTILNYLHKYAICLHSCRRKDAAMLKPRVRLNRVQWVLQIRELWVHWAARTIYVDESIFYSTQNYRLKIWAHKHSGEMHIEYVIGSGWRSVCVFAGLCGDELLPPYFSARSFDWPQLIDVLNELYLPVIMDKFGDSDWRIQMDNSPVHRARAVTNWVNEQDTLRGRIIFQPPYSPDLNPIEHVWARIKRMISREIYNTEDEIRSAVIRAFDAVNRDKAFLCALTRSMPRRMQAVLDAQGGPTRY